MILQRDRIEGGQVKDREEYIEALVSDLKETIDLIAKERTSKSKQRLYEALSDSFELYNCLTTQCLHTKRDTSTKARYVKAQEVSKHRAETYGGFFNGVTVLD